MRHCAIMTLTTSPWIRSDLYLLPYAIKIITQKNTIQISPINSLQYQFGTATYELKYFKQCPCKHFRPFMTWLISLLLHAYNLSLSYYSINGCNLGTCHLPDMYTPNTACLRAGSSDIRQTTRCT